ncbi:MAG TPA: DUF3343 domain-containing protein [Bacteroidetes bacterium]|nr:DUF3343 domain-containing protein [Bacteroidota bacterium]
MEERRVFLFRNIHNVIQGEKAILEKGYWYQIIPVPSNISSECGMCIHIKENDYKFVKHLLETKGIAHSIEII